jgi:hypothetical protein
VDLKDGFLANATQCAEDYVIEYYDSIANEIKFNGTTTVELACIHIIDLASLDSRLVGFRRGFMSYPYGYLSPGQLSTIVRLDLVDFGLNSTRYIDMSSLDVRYGGYSGGFVDHDWACFK